MRQNDSLQGRQELLEILQHCLAELNTIESQHQAGIAVDPFAIVEIIEDVTPEPTLLANEIKALTTVIELLTELPDNFATLAGAYATTKFIAAATKKAGAITAGIPTDLQEAQFETKINEQTAPVLMAALVAQLSAFQKIIHQVSALQQQAPESGKRNLVEIKIPAIGCVGENALSVIPLALMKIREIIRKLPLLAKLTMENEQSITNIMDLNNAIALNLSPEHFIEKAEQPLTKRYRQDELKARVESTFEILERAAKIKPFYEYIETNMVELYLFNPLQSLFKTLLSAYANFNDHIPLLLETEMQLIFGSDDDVSNSIDTLKKLIQRRIPQLCQHSNYLSQLYQEIQAQLRQIDTILPGAEEVIVNTVIHCPQLQLDSEALSTDDKSMLDLLTQQIKLELNWILNQLDAANCAATETNTFTAELQAIENCTSSETLQQLQETLVVKYSTSLQREHHPYTLLECIQDQLNQHVEKALATSNAVRQEAIEAAISKKNADLISGNISALHEELKRAKTAMQPLAELKMALIHTATTQYKLKLRQNQDKREEKRTLTKSRIEVVEYKMKIQLITEAFEVLITQAKEPQTTLKELVTLFNDAARISIPDQTTLNESLPKPQLTIFNQKISKPCFNHNDKAGDILNSLKSNVFLSSTRSAIKSRAINALEQFKAQLNQLTSTLEQMDKTLLQQCKVIDENVRTLIEALEHLPTFEHACSFEGNLTQLKTIPAALAQEILNQAQAQTQIENALTIDSLLQLQQETYNQCIEAEYRYNRAQHDQMLHELLATTDPSDAVKSAFKACHTTLALMHDRLALESPYRNTEQYQKQFALSQYVLDIIDYKNKVQHIKNSSEAAKTFTDLKTDIDQLEAQKIQLQNRLATFSADIDIAESFVASYLKDDFYSDIAFKESLNQACELETAVKKIEPTTEKSQSVNPLTRTTLSEKLIEIKQRQQADLPKCPRSTAPIAVAATLYRNIQTQLAKHHQDAQAHQKNICWTAETVLLGGADLTQSHFQDLKITGDLRESNFIGIILDKQTKLPTTDDACIDKVAFEILRQNLLSNTCSTHYLNRLIQNLFELTKTETEIEQSVISPQNIARLIDELIEQSNDNALDKASWLIRQTVKLSLSLGFKAHKLPEEWSKLIDQYDIHNENKTFSQEIALKEADGVNKTVMKDTVIPYMQNVIEMTHTHATLIETKKAANSGWSNFLNSISQALSYFIDLLASIIIKPQPKGLAGLACRLWPACGIIQARQQGSRRYLTAAT